MDIFYLIYIWWGVDSRGACLGDKYARSMSGTKLARIVWVGERRSISGTRFAQTCLARNYFYYFYFFFY